MFFCGEIDFGPFACRIQALADSYDCNGLFSEGEWFRENVRLIVNEIKTSFVLVIFESEARMRVFVQGPEYSAECQDFNVAKTHLFSVGASDRLRIFYNRDLILCEPMYRMLELD